MNASFYTSASGRIACLLTAVGILLPYLLRPTRVSQALGFAPRHDLPYLRRMWPHYWTGYLSLGLSFYHAWVSMAFGRIPRTSLAGLWLATFALFLLFVQLLLGLVLQKARGAPAIARRLHFWSMVEIFVLVLAHIALNGSLPLLRISVCASASELFHIADTFQRHVVFSRTHE
jgi:hypothetical protein